MNNHLMFRPNLNDCILEDRALMANSNLGIIILTTSGLSLVTPFPGANSSGAGSLGSNGGGGGSASSVSGLPIPTSLFITGAGGISSLRPGNITGVPSLAGGAGGASGGGLSATIRVGSGADAAGGPTGNGSNGGATNNVVSRATVADPLQPSIFTFIGGQSTSTNSPVLPPGQSYRDSAPVQPSAPMGVVNQTATGSGGMNSGGLPMLNPQLGAPRLGPFNSPRGMSSSMPGSLVPITPMLPGNN
jgi:hypothetical protein